MKKEIKKVVIDILKANPQTRNSDKILYLEVTKMIYPDGLFVPFYMAMHDPNMPNYDSVTRARRWAQAHIEGIQAVPTVQAVREEEEEEYKEVFANG